MGDLRELIARVERADGPGRQLDAWIAAHVGAPGWKISEVDGMPLRCGPGFDDLPAYTVSVDCAMSLVPEGWEPSLIAWNVPALTDANERVWASVVKVDHRQMSAGKVVGGNGATPALALCIAALKAREADDG